MQRRMQPAMRALSSLGLLLLAGCVTSPPVSSNIRLDPAARPQCEQHCHSLGLQMTAIVLYSNRAGCVCELPQAKTSAASSGGAAAAAAGVLVNEESEGAASYASQSASAQGASSR
jgi:hypothetical protein